MALGLVTRGLKMSNEKLAREIAKKTEDAYSFDRYSSWWMCAKVLLDRGYNEEEVEAILRSKWMRWAGDASHRSYGKYNSEDILNFIENPINRCTKDAVRSLIC
jgi:hypothetical protein